METLTQWQTRFFLWIGLPLIAAMGLVYGTKDLVPAWNAHSGSGAKGTFTALREDCTRRSCSFYGDWEGEQGQRADMILYDEPDGMQVGDSIPAIDSGARKGVFAQAGGYTYLIITAMTVGGAGCGVWWIIFLVRRFRARFLTPAPA